MINDAMFYDKEKLNPFTSKIKELCTIHGSTNVKLRDGQIREVTYKKADPEEGISEGFMHGDWDMIWFADGSSVTNKDFDMVENA